MFLLGLLGLGQTTFLPGFLFLRFFKFNQKSILQTLIQSFLLSQLTSYVLACVLTILHLYVREVVLAIVGIEVFAFCCVTLGAKVSEGYFRIVTFQSILVFLSKNTWLNRTIIITVITVVSAFFYYLIKNFGQVFMFADEIGSYNNWAVQWTHNRMPNPMDTMGYPILIPANWSLQYLILGNAEPTFFAKLLPPLYPLAAALGLVDLGCRQRSMIPLLTLPFFLFILRLYIPSYIGSGPLDLPAACIGFLVFYTILGLDSSKSLRETILVFLIAVTSSLMKQSGLFVVGLTIAWYIHFVYQNRARFLKKEFLKNILINTSIVLFLSLSWYVWIRYLIYEGRSTSESRYLISGIHVGLSYSERFFKALHMIFGGGPLYNGRIWSIGGIAFLTVMAFASVFEKQTRLLFLGLVVPFFLLWAFDFSYEHRTLALVFPFFAYCAATGFYQLYGRILGGEPAQLRGVDSLNYRTIPQRIFLLVLASLLLFAVTLNFSIFSRENILARQDRLQREIINPALNQQLYEYHHRVGITGKIAAQYGIMRFLPELKQFYFPLNFSVSDDVIRILEERDDIRYILVHLSADPTIYGFTSLDKSAADLIRANIVSGKYKLLFREGEISFVQIK